MTTRSPTSNPSLSATRSEASAPPRVSVLVAVFNCAVFLPEALGSLAGQTYGDFEIIAVDDGSTDGSAQVLQDFAAGEPRMRVISRENRGLIATRNELLEAAQGDLIAWMDSDDVSLPDRLALQVARFDSDPALVCVGGVAQCIDPEGNELHIERYSLGHDDIRSHQQQGSGMRFPTTMMRREPALRVGGFREPFKMCEDLDLLLRLGETGRLANLPVTIYLYRQHLSSVCAAIGPNWIVYRDGALALARERAEIGEDRLQLGQPFDIPKVEVLDTRALIAQTYRYWSDSALRNRNYRLAWRYAGSAIATRPTAEYGWRMGARIALAWWRAN